jgi:hypothetical protein
MPLALAKEEGRKMQTTKQQIRPPAMGYPWRNATASSPVLIAGGLFFFRRCDRVEQVKHVQRFAMATEAA